jgi:hypothetical protein
MLATREQRGNAALGTAQEQFEQNRVPEIKRGIEALERPYREYVRDSLGLEEQMRNASETLRRTLPKICDSLEVLERAGVLSFESVSPTSDLKGIGHAVQAAYRSLPEKTRNAIERDIRREQRELERIRDRSLEMDFH